MKHFKNILACRLSPKCAPSFWIFLLVLSSCNSEDANDCFQTDGKATSYIVELPIFSKIQMENDIRVLLSVGPEQKVTIETGENLIPDLVFKVEQETLVLQNNNGCNFLRDYGRTLVKITSPNIDFIRQASSFELHSEGVLTYPELTIWSNTNPNSLQISGANKSGEVRLSLDVQTFNILANGSSNFIITGRAENSFVNFSDEFPQLDGRLFLVDDLRVKHVSAGNMVVHPLEVLRGEIRATGDVISVNRPPVVTVDELFTGKLIFE